MKKIDGELFKQMILSATNNLYNNYQEIDELNVFPIPDGDTGTNMNSTMNSGFINVINSKESDLFKIGMAFKEGLLNGSKGNSGSILSQIWRGFCMNLQTKQLLEANAYDIVDCFNLAKDLAYKNTINPVEGTMLTVVREAAVALTERVKENMHISEVFDIYLEEAKQSLARTPDLLPVLKEVGVVDSGAAGYVKVIEGMALALHNKIVEKNLADVVSPDQENKKVNVQSKFQHEEFGYCTEFIIRLCEETNLDKLGKQAFNHKKFNAFLQANGNSIVSIHDENIVKVHIHTLNPGYILNYAIQFGEFTKIKIENMAEQHSHLTEGVQNEAHITVDKKAKVSQKAHTPFGIVAVCVGAGLENLFKDLSVNEIISGGQSMNPSAGDIIKAIKDANADDVFVFPNNSNIIMTAEQARDMLKEEGYKTNVHVMKTKSIPQGITGCMFFNPSATAEENLKEMNEQIAAVKTGEVTYAVRDTKIDDVEIHKDDFMAISGKKIFSSTKKKVDALKNLIDGMVDEDSSIITVYFGEDVDEKELDKVNKILQQYEEKGMDIEIHDGGQPVYSFFVSVE